MLHGVEPKARVQLTCRLRLEKLVLGWIFDESPVASVYTESMPFMNRLEFLDLPIRPPF